MAFSYKGDLNSHLSVVQVWDGSGLERFYPQGHAWVSTLWNVIPQSGFLKSHKLLGMRSTISIFSGIESNASTAFITLESTRVYLFFLIPVLDFGSGTGGMRLQPYTKQKDTRDDVCSPSGIFARVAPSISSPFFGKIVRGYFGKDWVILSSSVDLALHIERKTKALRSVQIRLTASVVFFDILINHAIVQIQYLSPKELERRKRSRRKEYGCKCPKGYDENGICREVIGFVDDWAQSGNISRHIMTISVDWKASVLWDLFSIRDAKLLFVAPIGVKSPNEEKPLLIINGFINILFVKNFGASIQIQHPTAGFSFTTSIVDLFEAEIIAHSNSSELANSAISVFDVGLKNQAVRDTGYPSSRSESSLDTLNWVVQLTVKFDNWVRSYIQKLTKEFHKIIARSKNLWYSLFEGISPLIKRSTLDYRRQEYNNLQRVSHIQKSKNPLLAFLLGNKTQNLFPHLKPLRFIFQNGNDTIRTIHISFPFFQFKYLKLQKMNISITEKVDFGHQENVNYQFRKIASQLGYQICKSMFDGMLTLDQNFTCTRTINR